MAETTWKQAVYDIADAYREAEGTTDKISIANLKEKVRDGGGKVYLDGERIKELNMTSYQGDNPYTMGQDGMSFDANILIKDGLTIINGVSGEDLTETASNQTEAVSSLMAMVARKLSDHKGEGEYVWKKTAVKAVAVNPTFASTKVSGTKLTIDSPEVDLTLVDMSFFNGFRGKAQPSGYIFTMIYENNQLTIKGDGGVNFIFTAWDASTKTFTINTSWDGLTVTASYEGTKLVYETSEDDYNYVVSDDPNAYPNKAERENYYYELYERELTLEMFECSKVAIDKFTFSVDTAIKTSVSHSLGEVPKIAIIIPYGIKVSNTTYTYLGGIVYSRGQAQRPYGSRFYNSSTTAYKYDYIQWDLFDTRLIAGYGDNVVLYKAGVEYTLITMA